MKCIFKKAYLKLLRVEVFGEALQGEYGPEKPQIADTLLFMSHFVSTD